ncbi:iron ABC transporter permease [Selenomonas timonae]|uniref:Iron ABC transporter permease n=1 Tax=Selenomonas timonae TaxID=2754044 RepID=A0A7G7VJS7_9FIRM|nr:iron ABC transporter permease [Selenomonas timonae]QNH54370.1 iron ABC transporter permease [Selenomonas timonae]
MNRKDWRHAVILLELFLILLVSMAGALTIGTVSLSVGDVVSAVYDSLRSSVPIDAPGQGPLHDIVWLLRMPRILMAACIGAGLATSGVIMQAIVKNPLADPYILGVSSGASLGATAAILLGVGVSLGENFVGIAAFIGAFAISLAIVFIANMGGRANAVKLLLAGMALSAVCSAFASFIVYFANDKDGIQSITYWLMGSMAGAKWSTLQVMIPMSIIIPFFFYTQAKILNLMLLGDDTAITLGVDLHRYRQAYLLVSALLVGFAVYAAGMIGFVGLIVPHVSRMLVGADHRRLLPIAALSGAIFLVWADVLCRVIIPQTELPIGILISMIGAPCFIYLMVKRTYGFGGA